MNTTRPTRRWTPAGPGAGRAPVAPRRTNDRRSPVWAGPRGQARRIQSRGGGWLLPELPPRASDANDEPRNTPALHCLSVLEAALDARSAQDRCRWLRLVGEATRWDG